MTNSQFSIRNITPVKNRCQYFYDQKSVILACIFVIIVYNLDMPLSIPEQNRFTKKADKRDRILDAAYQLFLEQGIENVTISEIAERANVAKGTFYLYFKDKETLKEHLVTQKSRELFQNALAALHQTQLERCDDAVIFIVNYIIDVLAQNKAALRLIAKDLSFGVFNTKISEFFSDDHLDLVNILTAAAEREGRRLKNPQLLLYMIIELTSSTCFSCILQSKPVEISVFKPYLFEAIRQLIRTGTMRPHDTDTAPFPISF